MKGTEIVFSLTLQDKGVIVITKKIPSKQS